jgi:hypothetical protein
MDYSVLYAEVASIEHWHYFKSSYLAYTSCNWKNE